MPSSDSSALRWSQAPGCRPARNHATGLIREVHIFGNKQKIAKKQEKDDRETKTEVLFCAPTTCHFYLKERFQVPNMFAASLHSLSQFGALPQALLSIQKLSCFLALTYSGFSNSLFAGFPNKTSIKRASQLLRQWSGTVFKTSVDKHLKDRLIPAWAHVTQLTVRNDLKGITCEHNYK